MVNVTDLLESKFGTPIEPSCRNRGADSVRVSEKEKDLIDEREVQKQVSNPNGVEGNHDGFDSSFSHRESVEGEVMRDEEEERISQLEGSMHTGNEFNGSNLIVDLRDEEEERDSQLEGSVITGNEFNGNNLVVDLRDEKEERVSHLEGSVLTGNEFNGINLVVDLSPRMGLDGKFNSGNRFSENGTDNKYGVGVNAEQNVVINEHAKNDVERKRCNELRGKKCRTDKEGEYEVSDLVWGKVRSHPWWPGQIFDPSAASEKAKKHCKKDSSLIAYFGDQTFAWNDASQIKPFRKHFLRMEKQSRTEAFCHAVDCALDEVSRRIEFGLACSCLEEDVYTRIKSQVVVNAGISEESSKRVGGDSFSTADSFVPANLFQCIKALALNPFGGTERLEFVTARAQLLAYNRWKGYYQLSTENLVEALLESDADEPVERQERTEDTVAACGGDEHVTSGKRKSTAPDSSSRKRKHIPTDSVCPSKKEKRLSDLTSGDILNLPNGKDKSVKAGKSTSSSRSGRKRKVAEPLSAEPKEESAKTTFRVGESIRRIVRRLSVATPILKSGDKRSQKPVSGTRGKLAQAPHAVPLYGSKNSQVVKVPEAYPPSDEIFSQLCLMAVDPMKENSFSTLVLRFFTDFRGYCSKNAEKKSAEKAYVEGTVKSSPNSETMEASRLVGFEDSYWTDRIVQINSEDQVLFEPEVSTFGVGQKSEHGTVVASVKSDAEKPAGHLDDNRSEYSGAALLLNFDKKASVPSVTNLNSIYSQYGPLKEVSTKNKRAKVVFERSSDAETAFSSSGKYSTFGPSLLTYSLDYSPTPRKRTNPARKQTKEKEATPANTTSS